MNPSHIGMNARQVLSNIIAKAGAQNYGARAGETIAGNLVRGANGKFAAGGGGASATPNAESADPKEVASVLKRLLSETKASKPKGGKAAKPKAPPKGKKPPKAKKDEVKVGRGRNAEQDAKRAAIISKLPIAAADKATLSSIINGEKVKPAALTGLVKAGLVQVRGDGSFELTGIANALARAKENNDMGKLDGAKRALKQAYAAIKSAETAEEDDVIVETIDVSDDQLAAIAGVLGVSYAKEIDGAMSFEAIGSKVSNELREQYAPTRPDGSKGYVWVNETYLTEVIADVDDKHYRIGYSIDRDGAITIEDRAKWVQVERISSWQAVAKGDIDAATDAPVLFIASGAYGPDTDGEWMSEAMLGKVAKSINEGKLPMTVDIWHVGFPSAKNPKPASEPVIVGNVAKAEVINKHLVLTPTFASAEDEATVKAKKADLQLSVYFSGAISKSADGAINGMPNRASVAILPRGSAAYRYSQVI